MDISQNSSHELTAVQPVGRPQPPYNPYYTPGDEKNREDELPPPPQIPSYPPATVSQIIKGNGQEPSPSTLDAPSARLLDGKPHGRNHPRGPENDGKTDLDFNDKSLRRRFIKKVYCNFIFQSLCTLGILLPFVFNRHIKKFAVKNCGLAILPWFLALICFFSMTCFESLRRSSPMKSIFAVTFTISEGVGVGFLAANLPPSEVAEIVGATAVLCFALTCLAYRTKWDFTGLGIYIVAAWVFIFILAIFHKFFFDDPIIIGSRSDHLVGGFVLLLCYSIIKFSLFSLYSSVDLKILV